MSLAPPLKNPPTINANGKTVGRPPKLAPADAASRIEVLAADAHSMQGIASEFKVSVGILNRWLKEDAELKEAFDRGRDQLHKRLKVVLLEKALAGDTVPLLFALKCMFGWREGDPSEQGQRAVININLPGARPLSDFITIENDPDTRTERLPDPSAVPTRRG